MSLTWWFVFCSWFEQVFDAQNKALQMVANAAGKSWMFKLVSPYLQVAVWFKICSTIYTVFQKIENKHSLSVLVVGFDVLFFR